MYSEYTLRHACGELVTVTKLDGTRTRGYWWPYQCGHEAYIEVQPGSWDEATVRQVIHDNGAGAAEAEIYDRPNG